MGSGRLGSRRHPSSYGVIAALLNGIGMATVSAAWIGLAAVIAAWIGLATPAAAQNLSITGFEAQAGLGVDDIENEGGRDAFVSLDVISPDLVEFGPLSLRAIGAVETDIGGDVYGGAGAGLFFSLGLGPRLEASVLAGGYGENDTEIDGPFAVRSRIGASMTVLPKVRLGVAFQHKSEDGPIGQQQGVQSGLVTLGLTF